MKKYYASKNQKNNYLTEGSKVIIIKRIIKKGMVLKEDLNRGRVPSKGRKIYVPATVLEVKKEKMMVNIQIEKTIETMGLEKNQVYEIDIRLLSICSYKEFKAYLA